MDDPRLAAVGATRQLKNARFHVLPLSMPALATRAAADDPEADVAARRALFRVAGLTMNIPRRTRSWPPTPAQGAQKL
jgi:hypothetical protein